MKSSVHIACVDEKLAPMPRTEHAIKVHRQEYYAIITHMDEQIGRILDGLRKSGLDKNTYMNLFRGSWPWSWSARSPRKTEPLEHSTRVPFIIKGPDIPRGKKVEAPIYLQDAMATSLALAGMPKPEHADFHNILPLAKGETDQSPHRDIYGAYLDAQRSITRGDLKLLAYPNVPPPPGSMIWGRRIHLKGRISPRPSEAAGKSSELYSRNCLNFSKK